MFFVLLETVDDCIYKEDTLNAECLEEDTFSLTKDLIEDWLEYNVKFPTGDELPWIAAEDPLSSETTLEMNFVDVQL